MRMTALKRGDHVWVDNEDSRCNGKEGIVDCPGVERVWVILEGRPFSQSFKPDELRPR